FGGRHREYGTKRDARIAPRGGGGRGGGAKGAGLLRAPPPTPAPPPRCAPRPDTPAAAAPGRRAARSQSAEPAIAAPTSAPIVTPRRNEATRGSDSASDGISGVASRVSAGRRFTSSPPL